MEGIINIELGALWSFMATVDDSPENRVLAASRRYHLELCISTKYQGSFKACCKKISLYFFLYV